jgi:hypothetical protein
MLSERPLDLYGTTSIENVQRDKRTEAQKEIKSKYGFTQHEIIW